MGIQTKYQTPEEISRICTQWIREVVPVNFPGYQDSRHNGDLLHAYVQANGRVYSLAILTEAAEHYKSNLHGLGVVNSAEYSAAQEKAAAEKAEAEHLQEVAAERDRILQVWLRDHCPVGLKASNGEPYAGDVDRILEFLRRNYDGQITIESLNDAVLTLENVLTWFSRRPEDRQVRGLRPKPRVLSVQAQIDAGMKIAPTERSHTKDTKIKNPIEALRPITKKALCDMQDPDKTRAEQIMVTTTSGKIDHGFTASLRKTFANNQDGSVNWKETLRIRTVAANEYEKRRNRDGGQRG
jgi:hypothetical protein